MKEQGRVSDKETLSRKVMLLAKGCISLKELETKLKDHSLKPYHRRGLLTDIWMGKKKFRLTTLGIGREHLKEMRRK